MSTCEILTSTSAKDIPLWIFPTVAITTFREKPSSGVSIEYLPGAITQLNPLSGFLLSAMIPSIFSSANIVALDMVRDLLLFSNTELSKLMIGGKAIANTTITRITSINVNPEFWFNMVLRLGGNLTLNDKFNSTIFSKRLVFEGNRKLVSCKLYRQKSTICLENEILLFEKLNIFVDAMFRES